MINKNLGAKNFLNMGADFLSFWVLKRNLFSFAAWNRKFNFLWDVGEEL